MVQKRIAILLAVLTLALLVGVLLFRRSPREIDKTVEDVSSVSQQKKDMSDVPLRVDAAQEEVDVSQLQVGHPSKEDRAKSSAPPTHEVAEALPGVQVTNGVEEITELEPAVPKESVPISQREIDSVAFAMRLFFKEFGEYPSGTALQIARALEGENPKQLEFITFPRTDQNGAFLDPWKVPYSIEVTAAGELHMASSGPNQQFGDDDDSVVKKALNKTERVNP